MYFTPALNNSKCQVFIPVAVKNSFKIVLSGRRFNLKIQIQFKLQRDYVTKLEIFDGNSH